MLMITDHYKNIWEHLLKVQDGRVGSGLSSSFSARAPKFQLAAEQQPLTGCLNSPKKKTSTLKDT